MGVFVEYNSYGSISRVIPESPPILRDISSVSALTIKKNPQHTRQHPQERAKKIGSMMTKVVNVAASNRQHSKMAMKVIGMVLMMVDTEELAIIVPRALFMSASESGEGGRKEGSE